MHNKLRVRAAGVAALVFSAVIAACSTFHEEPGAPKDGGTADAGDAPFPDGGADVSDSGAVDARSDADAAIIGGETPPIGAVSCNGTTCALGDGCCFGDAGPACTTRATCKGFFLGCLTSATCGSVSTCCFDGTRSACALSCGAGGGICQVGSECATSVCGPVRCAFDGGAPIVPFNLCSDTSVIPATRDGVTCAR